MMFGAAGAHALLFFTCIFRVSSSSKLYFKPSSKESIRRDVHLKTDAANRNPGRGGKGFASTVPSGSLFGTLYLSRLMLLATFNVSHAAQYTR